MLPKTLILIIIGILIVSSLVALGFLSLLSWVVASVLCTIVIGVFGWLINLAPKTKNAPASTKSKVTEEKPTSKRWIVDKEIVLDSESYETFSIDLGENEHLFGEVSSDDPINVFLVNGYALNKFKNQEEFSYEDCGGGEKIKRTTIDFIPSKAGRWFLVVENETAEETRIEIRLFATR